MQLHHMVRGIINQVNPNVIGLVLRSKGYKIGPDAKQTPDYYPAQEIELQVQSADGYDLKQEEFVNIQGERKVVFAAGQLYGQDAKRGLGGDLLEFYGRVWKVVKRIESWEQSGWCKVLVVAQLDTVMDTTDRILDDDPRE
ncbi:hypothetical protein COMNV_00583 [Commensalibacter sp. Nvir]|nr:hypothetical protein COMNV_00583 [Commensalibacter sp. Nvir]